MNNMDSLVQDPILHHQLRALPQREMFFNYLGRTGRPVEGVLNWQETAIPTGPSQNPQSKRGFVLAWTASLTNDCLILQRELV